MSARLLLATVIASRVTKLCEVTPLKSERTLDHVTVVIVPQNTCAESTKERSAPSRVSPVHSDLRPV